MSNLTTSQMVDQMDVILKNLPARSGIPKDARVIYCDVLQAWGERLKIIEGIDPYRLRELAEAEREGRVVVLPKKGDRLYYAPYAKSTTGYDGELVFLRNTGDGSGEVRRVDVLVMFDNWAGGVPIKRTWRTKEEAEASRALAATEPKGGLDGK